HGGTVERRERLAVPAEQLAALGLEARALEAQVALVEPRDELALGDAVARAHLALGDVALERRHRRALHFAFDNGLGRDAIFAGGDAQESDDDRGEGGDELHARMARAEKRARPGARRLAQPLPFAPLVVALHAEDR